MPDPNATLDVTLDAADGYRLAVDRFEPATSTADAPSVVIAGAMGVPRRFYRTFAEVLARGGLRATTFDYRGIGGSAPPRLRGFSARALDWMQLDLAAVLADARNRHPRARVGVVGHSFGGQGLGLLPADHAPDAALLVTAQSGWWGHWPGIRRPAMWALWHLLIPGLAAPLGRFPMRLAGGGEDLPSGVAREWAAWGRSPGYLFDARHGLDLSGYARLAIPLRSYAFDDDAFAPRPAVEALLAHYAAAKREHRQIAPATSGLPSRIGHFEGWQGYVHFSPTSSVTLRFC